MTMTVRLPRPWAKLETHCWYWVKSGAPPALAPPQSRLGISYTDSTRIWSAEFAALTTPETSELTVLGLNADSQRACGWLAPLSRMTEVRASFGLAWTHRTP